MKELLLALLLAASIPASAQNVSCVLSGTLQDPTGAAIPGARIELTAERTGFVRATNSNNDGFFSFPDLIPDAFRVKISAPGFKVHTQGGISINSGQQVSLGVVTMQVGDVTESVVVTGEAEHLIVASSERAGVLTSQDLTELATRGRDLMDAVALLPGVVDLNETRESPGKDSIGSVYILGARDNQKNVTLDGVTGVDFGSGTSMKTMPTMDAISELKVLMSNYAAEYGRNSGGTISIITKGGGKQFHGSANFYHRHEGLNANGYFNNVNGLKRSPYRYNIFTYTLSGPVTIPKVFNRSRSKLYFFFSQGFTMQLTNVAPKTVTVPTAAERAGDFSASYDVNGRLRTVYDGQANQTPFPGNRIPAARFNRIGQKVLDLFPLPNYVDPNPSRRYQWNYISAHSYDNPRRNEMIRIDYSPWQNVQIYARYSQNKDEAVAYYGPWTTGSVNFPLGRIVYNYPGRSYSVHSTITIRPSMFNEINFGMSTSTNRYYPEDLDKFTRKGTGIEIPNWYPGNDPVGLIPDMTFSGVSNPANPVLDARISSYMTNWRFNPDYTLADNVSKVFRTHTFKFGVYLEQAFGYPFAANNVRGSLSFGVDRTNPLDSNYAYANALTGVYASYSQASGQPMSKLRFDSNEWYVQDDWRVRPGLSLSYGVRFVNAPPMWDGYQRQSTFIAGLFDPAKAPVLLRPALSGATKVAVDPRTGATYPAVKVGTFVPGVGDLANGMAVVGTRGLPKTLYTVPAVSLGPRLGFSWAPAKSGKLVVRGGGGTFFNRSPMGPMNSMTACPPNVYTPTAYHGTLDTLMQAGGAGALSPSSVTSMYGHHPPQTVYNYSFGIQQQVSRMLVLDVSYVGSLSRHFWFVRNINAVPAGAQFLDRHPENRDITTTGSALSANFLRPLQGWGDITFYDFGSTANYNSLQSSVTRRFRRGLFSASYTYSKVLGTAATDSTAVSAFFPARTRNYGVLSYDRPHVLSLRYNYRLPEPGKYLRSRVLGLLTSRWQISGIARFMSGAPFTPGFSTVDGANITGTPSESARPDVRDPAAEPVNRFGRPARGTFGNAGPNVLRGPGVNNWDTSLYRDIPIHEGRSSLQLRFESYNTFNHTQFSSLSTSARFDAQGNQVDPLFLQPTAARSPRRIQLAVRLSF